ncbi:hypothetical protein CSHISOI_04629 [Colletotrichum shisoi]|uniref:Uncharacterized protein n=1 Tax=Colletotrichum shisoi TaxID=2078593 RepID=A0A5Q4BUZ0_9PEZI|nr:hypothetical protein CSHISOI_04629 [Colletotrichum shisoi]
MAVDAESHHIQASTDIIDTDIKTFSILPSAVFNQNSGHITISHSAKFMAHDKVPLIAALDDETNFDLTDRYQTSKLLGQLVIGDIVK